MNAPQGGVNTISIMAHSIIAAAGYVKLKRTDIEGRGMVQIIPYKII
jgi:hypothetical protein